MAKRKSAADGDRQDTVPVSVPVEGQQGNETHASSTENGGAHVNGDKRKPIVSWRVQSDRTTSIELACWSNTYKTQGGDEYEQLSFTVMRSYKNGDDQWVKGGSWRTHDIPVLMFLLSKAHAYALEQRTSGDVPF